MPGNESVLDEPIPTLNFSEEFKAMAKHNGFSLLRDIMEYDLNRFASLPGSGYKLLKELIAFLKERDLMHLVEEPLP